MTSRLASMVACALGAWLCALSATGVRAEPEHVEVTASAANPKTPVIHGANLVSRDPSATPRHRLVVHVPGTGGVATQAVELSEALARDGYHVIALDYPNAVPAASLRESKERDAFDRYRRALAFGGRVNDSLTVAPSSGLEARIVDLVRHLAATRGKDGWAEFVTREGIAWDKLILTGISQGAGHAAFLAQQHRVAKVLLLAGTQDYLTALKQPAPWLSALSRTPHDRYRVLLHKDDEYDVELQIAADQALIGAAAAHPVHFTGELEARPVAPAIVVSERALEPEVAALKARAPNFPAAHVSVGRASYASVWRYLLTH